jgi:DNA polymerase-3 subunit epsilon
VVAARREDDGRWAVHVIRHGRLAAAGVIPPGANAHLFVTELRATAETVTPTPGPLPAATAEESERILRWLESPSIRLIEIDGEWTCPVSGATRYLDVTQVPTAAPTERVLTPVPALLRSAP